MRKGFSLIELLVVLGVMGLIMGAMIPAVGVIRERAERMATGQQLRQLGLGVALYQDGGRRALIAEDMWDWMEKLARATGINDSGLYYVSSDPLLLESGKRIPVVVATKNQNSRWTLLDEVRQIPASVVLVSGVPATAEPSTTPVAWTRGLQTSGTWTASGKRAGVYGDSGGYIVFLDGHVRWYEDLGEDEGQLIDYDTGQPTSDITKALPPTARAMDYLGKVF